MSNQVLRPVGPFAGYFNSAWTVVPPGPYYSAIGEIVADGDASYLAASVPNSRFSVRVNTLGPLMVPSLTPPYKGGQWPKASRIKGILLVATVRSTDVVPVTFKFCFRCYDNIYDASPQTFTSNTYREIWQWFPLTPNGAAWSSGVFHDLEIGMVFISGTDLRCTKLEAHVVPELVPDIRLSASAVGTWNQFSGLPGSIPKEMTIRDHFDGDLSYIFSSAAGQLSTFTLEAPPPLAAPNIDRVKVTALVRTADPVNGSSCFPVLRSAGTDFLGGTNVEAWDIPANSGNMEGSWTQVEAEFLNDPGLAWPSGTPGALAWSLPQLAAVEAGLQSNSPVPVRCTALGVDLFLKQTPIGTINKFPNANGVYTQIPPLVPNAGEQAWQDIFEDPPDDAATYIGAQAVDGSPLYASFAFTPTFFPVGQILCVELRSRICLGSTPTAKIAQIAVDPTTQEIFIGKIFTLSNTGATWFDIKDDLFVSPLTGNRWSFAAVDALEYGVVILDGEVFVSRIRAQIQTSKTMVSSPPDSNDLQLTDAADFYINRSTLDGTIYNVDAFAVGTGGFNPLNPQLITPVVKADIALANEVLRLPITNITTRFDISPKEVTYWCRVPRDLLVGHAIGEIGLFATIIWSPIPAEIGTVFLFGILHMPAQCCSTNDTFLFPLKINYP